MTFSKRDVRLLVDMVRLSRVTLLVAEKGSDKSDILRSAVMPLLSTGQHGGEIPVFFDEWDEAPLSALHAHIRRAAGAAGAVVSDGSAGAFVEDLKAWHDALDATFLVILDRFERFLSAPADRPGFAEFEETLVQMANDPTLRANFLLALDERAEPLLGRLRRHIPRLGNALVRLPRDSQVAAQPQSATSRPAASVAETVRDVPNQPETAREARQPETERLAPQREAVVPQRDIEPVVPERKIEPVARPHEISSARERSAPPPASRPEAPIESPALTAPAVAPSERVEASAADTAIEAKETQRVPEPARSTPTIESALPRAPAELRTEPAQREPERRVEPGRRLMRVVWAPLLLVAAAVFFLWPRPAQRAPDVESVAAENAEAPKVAGDTVAKARPTAPAPPPASEASSGASKSVESVRPTTPATSSPLATAPVQPPVQSKTVENAPSRNRAAARSQQAEVAKAETVRPAPAAAQPPPDASQKASEAKAPVQPGATSDAAPKQRIAASTPLPSASRVAPEATPEAQGSRAQARREAAPKPEAAPKGAPSEAAPAGRASAGTSAAPTLYILVGNEAQRARAQQLIGPLKERGIHVAGIRIVGRSPDAAHIRYYRQADRNEAMRVAVALRDVGLSAQQLKQMPERSTALPARTYELWLP